MMAQSLEFLWDKVREVPWSIYQHKMNLHCTCFFFNGIMLFWVICPGLRYTGLNLQQCLRGLSWFWGGCFGKVKIFHGALTALSEKKEFEKRLATLTSLYFLTPVSLPFSALCLEFSFPKYANGLQLTSLRSLLKCYHLGEPFPDYSI